MRLLYFYGDIYSFDNDKKGPIEIDFSREYAFKPSKNILDVNQSEKKIEIFRAQDYIPCNFWSESGNVYNCTLLVGKNGSGKSTIIQNIMHAIIGCGEGMIGNNLLVWQECSEHGWVIRCFARNIQTINNTNDYLYYFGECEVNAINSKYSIVVQLNSVEKHTLGWKQKTKLMYFSNTLSKNDLLDSIEDHYMVTDKGNKLLRDMLCNVSAVKQLKEIISDRHNKEDQSNILKLFWDKRYTEEIEFIFDNDVQKKIGELRKNFQKFNIPVPQFITIYSVKSNYELNAIGIDDYIKIRNKLIEIADVGIKKGNLGLYYKPNINKGKNEGDQIKENNKNLFKYIIAIQSILRILHSYKIDVTELNATILRYSGSGGNSSYRRHKIVYSLIGDLGEFNIDKTEVNAVEMLIGYLYPQDSWNKGSPFDSICASLDDYNISIDKSGFVSISCKLSVDKLNEADKKAFIDFVQLYNNTLHGNTRPYFCFDWGLSSGEETMLHMLATIYKHNIGRVQNRELLNGERNTLLLFLDEADIGYHPEWQRIWFYIFPRIIEVLINDDTDIQFIMATHSPLLLGDIPVKSSNFIESFSPTLKMQKYLHTGMSLERGTFGQNLYTILQDGFFLENSALGEIAIKKSQEIAKGFELFRQLIHFINNKDEDCTEEELDKIKTVLETISNENKEKEESFAKDGIECKEETITIYDNTVMYGAYLKYIYILINIYSGVIRKKLLQEYQDIEWGLKSLFKETQIELINTEIQRLTALKEQISNSVEMKND